MSSSTTVVSDEIELLCTKRRLKKLLAELQSVNSGFPATRAFLKLRGLESVTELDQKGMRELRGYLRGIYQRLVH